MAKSFVVIAPNSKYREYAAYDSTFYPVVAESLEYIHTSNGINFYKVKEGMQNFYDILVTKGSVNA